MGRPKEQRQPADLYGQPDDAATSNDQHPPPYGQPQTPPPPPAIYHHHHQPPSPRQAQYPMTPPPPESYPPQKPPPPAVYPPQMPPPPAAFPPRSPHPQPAAFPPAQQFPPHHAGPQPSYQPNYQHVQQFPPPQPQPQPQPNYGHLPQSPMKPLAQGFPVGPAVNTEGWRSGLFDCLDDPFNAVITLLFPCLTFGQIAEIVDNGQSSCATGAVLYALIASFIGMPCIYSCTYRTKLRSKFGLVEAPAPDWLVHFVCEPCALCQAYRELNLRGFDPAIGWIGNVQRSQQLQQQQVMMTAPQNQTMYNN